MSVWRLNKTVEQLERELGMIEDEIRVRKTERNELRISIDKAHHRLGEILRKSAEVSMRYDALKDKYKGLVNEYGELNLLHAQNKALNTMFAMVKDGITDHSALQLTSSFLGAENVKDEVKLLVEGIEDDNAYDDDDEGDY